MQMRKLITLPGSDRRWRSWFGLVLSLPWLGLGAVHAATPLNGAWREVRANDTAQVVLAEYRAGQLKSFDPSLLQRFPRSTAGSWVVIASPPPWDNGERVLTIYPPPLSTATVFANSE